MPGYARRVVEVEGQEQLRDWIKRAGFDQQTAADFLGFSGALVSQWLSGARKPSLEAAFQVEAKTGVPARSWALSAVSKTKQAGRGNGSKR